MSEWKPMGTAPKDRDILVWYDHDRDPYQDPEDDSRLTDYAVWCESGNYLRGRGWAIARWFPEFFETTDGYGSGFYLPAWWFAREGDDYEWVCNPTRWVPLPAPPSQN